LSRCHVYCLVLVQGLVHVLVRLWRRKLVRRRRLHSHVHGRGLRAHLLQVHLLHLHLLHLHLLHLYLLRLHHHRAPSAHRGGAHERRPARPLRRPGRTHAASAGALLLVHCRHHTVVLLLLRLGERSLHLPAAAAAHRRAPAAKVRRPRPALRATA
jgi:hypothetical protein